MEGRTENKLIIEEKINNILLTLPKYVTEYYFSISTSKEPKTCLEYVIKIRHFLNFLNEDVNCIDISTLDDVIVGRYLKSIEITEINGVKKETSFSYRKSIWTILNGFFNYLSFKKYISYNPLSIIKRPKTKDEVSRVLLTSEDFNAILNVTMTGCGSKRAIERQREWKYRDILMMLIFMNTGMRESALSQINVEDVDLKENKLKIIDKRHKVHEYPIKPKLKAAFIDWLKKRDSLLKEKNMKCDALFISSQRTRLSTQTISQLVKKYTKEALGVELSPHKLRAGFCSILYDETNDIEFVRDAVGQESVETTKNYIIKKNLSREKSSDYMDKILSIY